MTPAPTRRYGGTPWLVLGASLLLTAAATAITALTVYERDQARFQNAVQSAHDRIVSRLDVYLNTLRAGAALFAVDPELDSGGFHRFVERLDIQRRYPGIQGIGWTLRTDDAWPDSATERHAILYLEPLDARNRAAIGFDMHSEPIRRDAMDRARDLGGPALSGRVTLVQEIIGPVQAGFLLYAPVYHGGGVPATLEERRRRLRGFVYAPFRAEDLFEGIFGTEEEPRVSFAVYDGERADTSALLHRSPRAHDTPKYQRTDELEFAGRRWTVTYASEPGFEEGSVSFFVPAALISGLLVSAWLFWLAHSQARARLAAETASTARARFLATMSHELRTPLNAIGGYVDLLDLGIPGPVVPQQREYLVRIQRAQQHLLGLINSILNFSKLEAGAVPFRVEPVTLAEVLPEAEAYVQPQLADHNIDFRIEGGPPVSVLADADKLRQILLNLLSNALKFTEPGGRVTVCWRVEAHDACIDIADTGIGIEPERLEQIFDPFVQVDADLARSRQGTGLGLAISRELARGMRGDITVKSEPGKGSTFTVHLPLAHA